MLMSAPFPIAAQTPAPAQTSSTSGRVVATVTTLDGTVHMAGMSVELRQADGTVLAKTVTDNAGQVSFPDVPPGRYTLKAWHERGGETSMDITLPMPQDVVVSLDARNYRFVQHLDKTGQRYDARGRRY